MKTKFVPSLVANLRRAIARTLNRLSGKAAQQDTRFRGTTPIDHLESTGALCPDDKGGTVRKLRFPATFRFPLSAFRFVSSLFRFPLSAFRFVSSPLRTPHSALLIAGLAASSLSAQRGPQDRWYEDSVVDLPSGVTTNDIIVTAEGTLLLVDSGNEKIHEFDENGSLIQSFGSTAGSADGQFNNPREVAIGPGNRIYVTDGENDRVQILERDGTFVKKFGTNGSGDGQFNEPWGLAISSIGEVFVADRKNHRIQVFDSNGTFLRKWGDQGNLDGQFNDPLSLDVDPAGDVYVIDYLNIRIMVFSKDGAFLRKFNTNRFSTRQRAIYLSLLPNGILSTGGETFGDYSNQLNLREKNGDVVKNIGFGQYQQGSYMGYWSPSTMFANGTLVFANNHHKTLHFLRQTYRTIRPNPSKDAPLPEVISVAQREGTNYLDLTYRINDADSSTVTAGLLAFIDGGTDLSKVIVPTTFVGGVAGKVGENVATGQDHLVTWNASADWSVGFGEVEMEVLAKDDRNLLNLHFLTLPGTDTNATELKISRTPVSNAELLSVWYWLVATGHSGITLENGTITLDSNSESLASSSSTTAAGRAYLLNLMNLREASASEVTRAKEGGTPGVINQFTPMVKVGPGERPSKVNEYSFETNNNSDFWVMPTN